MHTMLKDTVIDVHDHRFYTPVTIPSEISQYDVEIPHLGIGRAGKVGLLALTLENKQGQTVLVDNYHKVPLQVQKPFILTRRCRICLIFTS